MHRCSKARHLRSKVCHPELVGKGNLSPEFTSAMKAFRKLEEVEREKNRVTQFRKAYGLEMEEKEEEEEIDDRPFMTRKDVMAAERGFRPNFKECK